MPCVHSKAGAVVAGRAVELARCRRHKCLFGKNLRSQWPAEGSCFGPIELACVRVASSGIKDKVGLGVVELPVYAERVCLLYARLHRPESSWRWLVGPRCEGSRGKEVRFTFRENHFVRFIQAPCRHCRVVSTFG